MRIMDKCTEVDGHIELCANGAAFVISDECAADIFIPPACIGTAQHGDLVHCLVHKSSRRAEGEVMEVLQRARTTYAGTLCSHRRGYIVNPDCRHLSQSITIAADNLHGAQVGDKVAVSIIKWTEGKANLVGEVADILGKAGENNAEMHAILLEYGLPYRFEPHIETAANAISDDIQGEAAKRRDMRSIPTMTIDPVDAKDYDDALSLRAMPNGNYEVGVHIADVTHYVQPNTPLDQEAFKRATSVYLVDRVVPMLPESLSNGLCSLRPMEDKLCFSIIFEVNANAQVQNQWLGKTIINSKHRYNYEEVQQILESHDPSIKNNTSKAHPMEAATADSTGSGIISKLFGRSKKRHAASTISIDNAAHSAPEHDNQQNESAEASSRCSSSQSAAGKDTNQPLERIPTSRRTHDQPAPDGIANQADFTRELLTLHGLAQALRRQRFLNGSIAFERAEARFDLDQDGHPVGVYTRQEKESHQLVEEFMLLANRSVAEHVSKLGQDGRERTFVYRVHDEPQEQKLYNLGIIAKQMGFPINFDRKTKGSISKAINRLLDKVRGTPAQNLIETLALRSMAKAAYSTRNIGHYGLAFERYAHFTSPIRRYPDMMAHRLLFHYLNGGAPAAEGDYTHKCKHSSAMEQLAADAERASIRYKMAEYMKDKVGREYAGIISGVSKHGVYIEIDQGKIEGMATYRSFKDDYFYFDEENYRIIGRRTRRTYTLGDAVRIRVVRSDLSKRQVDYEVLSDKKYKHF